MTEDTNPISVLEEQLTALSDTRTNLVGLIEKGSRVQMDLAEAGYDNFSEEVAKAFGTISAAAEEIQKVHENIELERNRMQNE